MSKGYSTLYCLPRAHYERLIQQSTNGEQTKRDKIVNINVAADGELQSTNEFCKPRNQQRKTAQKRRPTFSPSQFIDHAIKAPEKVTAEEEEEEEGKKEEEERENERKDEREEEKEEDERRRDDNKMRQDDLGGEDDEDDWSQRRRIRRELEFDQGNLAKRFPPQDDSGDKARQIAVQAAHERGRKRGRLDDIVAAAAAGRESDFYYADRWKKLEGPKPILPITMQQQQQQPEEQTAATVSPPRKKTAMDVNFQDEVVNQVVRDLDASLKSAGKKQQKQRQQVLRNIRRDLRMKPQKSRPKKRLVEEMDVEEEEEQEEDGGEEMEYLETLYQPKRYKRMDWSTSTEPSTSAAAAVTAPQERIFKLPPAMQLASMMMNLPENYKKNVIDAFRRSGQTPEQASSVKSAIKFWEQQQQQPPPSRRRTGRILSLTDETVHPMVREVQKQLSPKKFRMSQRVKDKKLLQADQEKSEDWEEVVEEKKKTPVKRKPGRPRKTEAEKAAAAAAKALLPKKPRGRPPKKKAEEKKPAAPRVNKRKRRKDEDELVLQKYMKEDDDDNVFDAKKKSYTISKRDRAREQFYSV